MTYTNDWTTTDNPADHSKFKDQPSFIRKIRTDIEERLADLLYGFTSGDTVVGIKKLLMNNQAADPDAPVDAYVLFAKDSYVFTVSGITTMPTAGATYTNNAKTFTVLYASATQLYCSGTGAPAANGTLTKATGTGDATVAFSASTSTSELHIRHESAGIKIFTSLGKIIAGALTSLATIAADAGIIPIANLASGTPDGTKFIRDDGTLQNVPVPTPVFENALLHVRDEKAQGTIGDRLSAGNYVKRTLNTVKTNEIAGASVTTSVITLPAGTYYIDALAQASDCGSNHIRLRNTSDSTTVLVGMSGWPGYPGAHSSVTAPSSLKGRFTIEAEKTFEIQHYCKEYSGTGGVAASDGAEVEVYADVLIWKVA